MVIVFSPDRFPWYKRFPKDVLSSARVASMTVFQRGLYLILLERSWIEDGLPNDTESLAMLAMCPLKDFRKAWEWPLSCAFEASGDGRLRSLKMERVREDAIRVRNGNAKGGAATKSTKVDLKTLTSDLQVTSSGPQVPKMETKDLDEDLRVKDKGANAPAPQAEQATRRKRTNRLDNLNEACDKLEAPDWLRTALAGYMEARKSAKFKPWSVALWIDEAKQVLPMGEAVGSRLCMRASKKPWAMIVYEDQNGANVQPAASQAPQRGGWYTGPKLKDVEARSFRMRLRDKIVGETQNWDVEEDEAFGILRERGDWDMHDYDWKVGYRNDPPPTKRPLNGSQATIINIEPKDAPF